VDECKPLPAACCSHGTAWVEMRRSGGRGTGYQGLTLVHFSTRLEPCLTQTNTLHTLNSPYHALDTGYTIPTRTPYPIQGAQVELKSGRV
jgi:hypothetical protein